MGFGCFLGLEGFLEPAPEVIDVVLCGCELSGGGQSAGFESFVFLSLFCEGCPELGCDGLGCGESLVGQSQFCFELFFGLKHLRAFFGELTEQIIDLAPAFLQ